MTQMTAPDGTPASRHSFGAMQFGGNADEAESAAMYDACRAAGINFFDTASSYTGGASETILGRSVQQDRDGVVVATKAFYPKGASARNIHDSISQSLDRMGLDSVDLLYLHRWDADTPLEESFQALAEVQSSGRCRYLGVSNYAAWQVVKAQGVARTCGTRIDALQPMYNLVKRQAEVEILPMCRSEGIAAVPYSPLGGGLLTGKYARGEHGRLNDDHRYEARYGPAWMHEAARALTAIADELGVSPATLAVAWVARNPDVHGPILSARSVDQLRPSLAAIDFDMDDALYERLTALTPAPPPATDRLEEA
ncbi:aldo/keto reductase [Rhodobacteraceae bacterium CCMM004]|nr:aldo/keto reductase [Rhodobacteraceae bacterium CCMM004]